MFINFKKVFYGENERFFARLDSLSRNESVDFIDIVPAQSNCLNGKIFFIHWNPNGVSKLYFIRDIKIGLLKLFYDNYILLFNIETTIDTIEIKGTCRLKYLTVATLLFVSTIIFFIQTRSAIDIIETLVVVLFVIIVLLLELSKFKKDAEQLFESLMNN